MENFEIKFNNIPPDVMYKEIFKSVMKIDAKMDAITIALAKIYLEVNPSAEKSLSQEIDELAEKILIEKAQTLILKNEL